MKKVLQFIFKWAAIIIGSISVGYGLGLYVGEAGASIKEPRKKVVIIDSGINMDAPGLKLCNFGHKDFTGTSLKDKIGHGSPIASIISSYINEDTTCVIVLKAIKDSSSNSFTPLLEALKYALNLEGTLLVNLSIEGSAPSYQENYLVKALLDKSIVVTAAAGNGGINLDAEGCFIYPACIDNRIEVVGALGPFYNKGKVLDYVDNGSRQSYGRYSINATSAATAHVSGKLARNIMEKAAL